MRLRQPSAPPALPPRPLRATATARVSLCNGSRRPPQHSRPDPISHHIHTPCRSILHTRTRHVDLGFQRSDLGQDPIVFLTKPSIQRHLLASPAPLSVV